MEGHGEQHHVQVQTLQGPQPSPRRWRISTPCSTANTCANLGEIGVRDPLAALFCFRLSAGTYAERLEATGVALVGIDAGGEISLV